MQMPMRERQMQMMRSGLGWRYSAFDVPLMRTLPLAHGFLRDSITFASPRARIRGTLNVSGGSVADFTDRTIGRRPDMARQGPRAWRETPVRAEGLYRVFGPCSRGLRKRGITRTCREQEVVRLMPMRFGRSTNIDWPYHGAWSNPSCSGGPGHTGLETSM